MESDDSIEGFLAQKFSLVPAASSYKGKETCNGNSGECVVDSSNSGNCFVFQKTTRQGLLTEMCWLLAIFRKSLRRFNMLIFIVFITRLCLG